MYTQYWRCWPTPRWPPWPFGEHCLGQDDTQTSLKRFGLAERQKLDGIKIEIINKIDRKNTVLERQIAYKKRRQKGQLSLTCFGWDMTERVRRASFSALFSHQNTCQCACLGGRHSIRCAPQPARPFTVHNFEHENHEDWALMDSQGGSVRRNIALKLRGDPSTIQKVQQPEPKKGGVCVLIDAHLHEAYVIILSWFAEDTTIITTSVKAPPVTSTTSSSKKTAINVVLRSGEDLQWDQKIHLVGRCLKDPTMHICEICSLPILIYGRMVSLYGIFEWFRG